MKLKKIVSLSVLYVIFGVAGSFAADKPWKNATEFSYLSTNGNSRGSTLSGKNTYDYNWSKTSLEVIGGGLGSSSNGQSTAEKYFASEKTTYKVSDRNYLYERGAWDKDRFSGIKNREDMNAGLGREFLKLSKDLLIGEFGAGEIIEERYDTPTNKFGTSRVYSKYTHTISDTASFSQDAEYLYNFKDKEDFRVNTESDLLAVLTKHMSLKLSYVWKYVGKPPLGFGRSDTTTAVALVATY